MPSEQPEILVANRQSLPVDAAALTSLAQTSLTAEGIHDGELSVSLVTVDEIARLHEQYMGESGPTDVLSFPMDEAVASSGPAETAGPRVLGDVVICPEFAARNGSDLDSELRLLLVHGILHLLGYDHEQEQDRAEMWALQERYSGVPSPATHDEEAAG
jgi:probable rRNA maturation factor